MRDAFDDGSEETWSCAYCGEEYDNEGEADDCYWECSEEETE